MTGPPPACAPQRWEELPKGGFALEKAGTFLLEMANAKAGAGAGDSKGGYGQRAYDWDNKQSFALGVGEAAELVDLNEGRRREIRAVHDPMKGAEGQGATMKSFSVSTLDAKDGGASRATPPAPSRPLRPPARTPADG